MHAACSRLYSLASLEWLPDQLQGPLFSSEGGGGAILGVEEVKCLIFLCNAPILEVRRTPTKLVVTHKSLV